MSAALKPNLVSVADYLAGELESTVKHEYLAGVVYAMAGARIVHNVVKGNLFATLHNLLRGERCRPYNSGTKVRVLFPTHTRFYYPDVSVVCHSNHPNQSYQDNPVVIVEVLSRSTRRIDEVEKKDAYLTMPTLSAYLLVEQEFPFVTVHRRTDQGFVRETYDGTAAVIPLPEVGIELPLGEVYEGVEFVPEEAEVEP